MTLLLYILQNFTYKSNRKADRSLGCLFVLMLSNEDQTTREALELGLVNRLVPAEGLEAEAMAIARQIETLPASSVRMAKRLVNHPSKDLQ